MTHPVKWISVIQAVDLDTGELLDINVNNLKDSKYEILKKTSTARIKTLNGKEIGERTITWHCKIKKRRQLTLFR